MTIKEFAEKKKCKESTVKKWIHLGYIPGANIDTDFIPDSARVPYTKTRAKTAKAIYSSIIKASANFMHVVHSLYGISPDEFDGYIRRLEQEGLIERRVTDNVTYYDATIKATRSSHKLVLDIIERGSKGIASAVTEAVLEKV